MDVLVKLDEMIAAKQADVNDLGELKAEFEKLQAAPVGDAMDQFKADLEKAKSDLDAKVKECDDLRAAIDDHFADEKADLEKFKAKVAPIQPAPAPVIPDVPAAPAPTEAAPVDAAPVDAAPVDAAPAFEPPTAGPTAQL